MIIITPIYLREVGTAKHGSGQRRPSSPGSNFGPTRHTRYRGDEGDDDDYEQVDDDFGEVDDNDDGVCEETVLILRYWAQLDIQDIELVRRGIRDFWQGCERENGRRLVLEVVLPISPPPPLLPHRLPCTGAHLLISNVKLCSKRRCVGFKAFKAVYDIHGATCISHAFIHETLHSPKLCLLRF